MRHKKRKLDEKSAVCSLIQTALLGLAIWYAMMINGREYCDRKKCICSVLTSEEQTLESDERLDQVCRIEDIAPEHLQLSQCSVSMNNGCGSR